MKKWRSTKWPRSGNLITLPRTGPLSTGTWCLFFCPPVTTNCLCSGGVLSRSWKEWKNLIAASNWNASRKSSTPICSKDIFRLILKIPKMHQNQQNQLSLGKFLRIYQRIRTNWECEWGNENLSRSVWEGGNPERPRGKIGNTDLTAKRRLLKMLKSIRSYPKHNRNRQRFIHYRNSTQAFSLMFQVSPTLANMWFN